MCVCVCVLSEASTHRKMASLLGGVHECVHVETGWTKDWTPH